MRKIYNSWKEYEAGITILPNIRLEGKQVDHVKNLREVIANRGEEGVKDYTRAALYVGRKKSFKEKLTDIFKRII